MLSKEEIKKRILFCKSVDATIALKAFEFCLENDEKTIEQTKSLLGCLVPNPQVRKEMNKVFELVLEGCEV